MPEPIVPEEKKEDIQPDPEEAPVKSSSENPQEPAQETPKPEPQLSPLDEAKRYLDEQKATQAKEAARIADERARETTREEHKRLKDEEKRESQEQDELKTAWEKEGRAPKDYDEIARENRRIMKLELKREQRIEEENRKIEQAKEKLKTEQTSQQEMTSLQEQIGKDLTELYEGGYLPRPVKAGDPEDAGEKAKKVLFDLGIKINQERVKGGQAPEKSIAKIFFLNQDAYKKALAPKEVAGADAPVAGAKPGNTKQESQEYNYQRDHNKSFRQLAMEARKAT